MAKLAHQRRLSRFVVASLRASVPPARGRREVEVASVPGVERVTVEGPCIVAIDGAGCVPLVVQVPCVWKTVRPGQYRERRPRGSVVVDGGVFSELLTCWCGSRRYVKPNCVWEVRMCWRCVGRVRALRRKARSAAGAPARRTLGASCG